MNDWTVDRPGPEFAFAQAVRGLKRGDLDGFLFIVRDIKDLGDGGYVYNLLPMADSDTRSLVIHVPERFLERAEECPPTH